MSISCYDGFTRSDINIHNTILLWLKQNLMRLLLQKSNTAFYNGEQLRRNDHGV